MNARPPIPPHLLAEVAAGAEPPPGHEPPDEPTRRLRAIWISDVHLGTKGCKAEYLLEFLRNHDSEVLYLVGDVVDGWQLKKSWYWHQTHNDVVQKVLRKARKGTRVVYVPGNHDEGLRHFLGHALGGISIVESTVHEMLDGRRLLVTHGDQFDHIVQHARWLARLGDELYTVILEVNHWFNRLRTRLGFPYWSLSQYLKHQVKNAVNFISEFEDVLAYEARRRGLDGVVCGHIHKAEIRDVDGILYCNDGDWVESLTALVETTEGELLLVDWRGERVPTALKVPAVKQHATGASGPAEPAGLPVPAPATPA